MYTLGLRSLVDPRRDEFPKFIADEATRDLAKAVTSCDYSYDYPPVDDQGPFGTCVAFGNKKVFEFYMKKRLGKDVTISAKALWSQLRAAFYPGDTQDDGAQVSDALKILEQNYVLDSDMPYETRSFVELLSPVPDALKKTDFLYKNFVAVNPTVADCKYALLKHGPLSIGTNFANEWMGVGSDGNLQSTNLSSAGGHCMSIVGYDDNHVNADGSKGAFKYINNWTTGWGDKGYAYLPYNVDPNFFPSDVFVMAA
jgi:C1A family cysteine protease